VSRVRRRYTLRAERPSVIESVWCPGEVNAGCFLSNTGWKVAPLEARYGPAGSSKHSRFFWSELNTRSKNLGFPGTAYPIELLKLYCSALAFFSWSSMMPIHHSELLSGFRDKKTFQNDRQILTRLRDQRDFYVSGMIGKTEKKLY
jgi:hypothetical protein